MLVVPPRWIWLNEYHGLKWELRATRKQSTTQPCTDFVGYNVYCKCDWSFTSLRWWISNHMPSKRWDEVTNPLPNINGGIVEVWEWLSNFILHFMMDVITNPYFMIIVVIMMIILNRSEHIIIDILLQIYSMHYEIYLLRLSMGHFQNRIAI